MKKKIFLFFCFAMFLPMIVHAETYWGGELPNISNTQLKVAVTVDRGGIYSYTYTIISGAANTGKVLSLDIDIKQPPGGVELSKEGIINGPHYLQYTSTHILADPTTPKMIPVGLWSPPGWISGLNVFREAGWGGALMQPGQTLTGFQMTSRGLPSIRDFRIEPELVPPSAGDTKEPPLAPTPGQSLALVKAVEDKAAFKNKTIGPSAPPADFKPIKFLDYIISLKKEAYNLGWIVQDRKHDREQKEDEEKGIMRSLDKKLDIVRESLVKGHTRAAREILEAFIFEVTLLHRDYKKEDRDKDKKDSDNIRDKKESKTEDDHREYITTEAYTLLKYNAQYLIEKLGGEKKEHKDKKD